jgi:2-deoxy-D-gluconate 3-dehydrogenase
MTSNLPLTGKTAVVTAAARGIGRAIAQELADNGADIVLGLRDAQHDNGLVEDIRSRGRRVLAVPMNVTDLRQCRTSLDAAAAEFGRIDILVNNAGGSIVDDALNVTEEDFEAVWTLNTKSTFFLSQHVARSMKDHGGGTIINIASQAGLVALPGESSYCTSKAAVIHLTKCLAIEWGSLGIRVNAVAPTFIETDGTGPALADPAFRADTIERIAALHRLGQPTEVAAAVAFLASPGASLITGITMPIDGGWTIR